MSGRQLRMPLEEFSVPFVGAMGSEKVNVCAGRFGSVAVFVMMSVCPAVRVRLLATLVNCGGAFEAMPVLMIAVVMEYGGNTRSRLPARLGPYSFSSNASR